VASIFRKLLCAVWICPVSAVGCGRVPDDSLHRHASCRVSSSCQYFIVMPFSAICCVSSSCQVPYCCFSLFCVLFGEPARSVVGASHCATAGMSYVAKKPVLKTTLVTYYFDSMSKTNLTLLVTLMVSLPCCVVGGIQVNLLHQVIVIAEHVATMHLVDERASPPINDCFRRIASMI